ncbi:gliding motility-associated-like protein [Pseudobacter ginsenosidimutans]|uniref:Gliding motility-associated-like protein n=1 Tax=Pseudobacter ginsenosidimutans TaxID=661488 RepID=A0A4Q7MZD4_9BACT|nr:PKD domain-containing protein [Pseudobacter ginsenosidimutans]RZS74323.1 gliding motility-associated-like protein [Pseudobacter ginsenosidimutans]
MRAVWQSYIFKRVRIHSCLTILMLWLSISTNAQTAADFSINKKEGCIPLSGVNFTDQSSGGTVTRRDWNLGNGTIINAGAATVGTNYLTDGKFYVTLTVTFSNGDIRTKRDSVIVHPRPVADFAADEETGCSPHRVNFTSLATTQTGTITEWLWDFGAGGSTQTDPSFTYNVNGEYNVSLIVKNNWNCESEAAIRLRYIKVYPKVNASFTIPDNADCAAPFTVNFVNTTTGGGVITYEWDFGDGSPKSTDANPTHTYTSTGAFTVTLTARNGSNCVSTYTTPSNSRVFVGKPQPAITAPSSVCANTSVNFSGSVTPADFLYSVKWLFPDNGAVQYGQNTSHTFTTPGTYNIAMVAFNYPQCNDTAWHTISVTPGPVAGFSSDKPLGCSTPFTVQFTDQSSPASGLTYDWNFGDGSPHDVNSSPSHTYTSFGAYTVSLTVTDPATGCAATKQLSNAVRIVKPRVDFTYTPPEGCKPLPVKATARLSDIVDPVTDYIWDFGDGTIITTSVDNATHTYTTAGTFNIKLTIVTQQGCTVSSDTKPVTVADICDDDGSGGGGGGGGGAGVMLGKTCADKYTVTFTDTVQDSQPISWDFGDGSPLYTTAPLNPVTHTFPTTAKKYLVTLTRRNTVTNIVSTAQFRAVIIDEKADFIPDIFNICINKTVNLATIGIDSSNINKYTWDFGDGTTPLMIDNKSYFRNYGKYLNGNTSHTYINNGVFHITLTIEDKLGCTHSFQYPVPVTVEGPVVGFEASPLTSCLKDFTVAFQDTSKPNGSTPIVEWTWNFGDGSPAFVTTRDTLLHHNYSNDTYYRFYNITLKIKDAAGCEAQVTRNNHVKSYRPKASFYSNDVLKCGNHTVTLYNNSSAYNATYIWYYGDGTSSTGYNGSRTYTADGEYDISLVVTDENGCRDSLAKEEYIKLVKPKADFIIGDDSKCAPIALQFFDNSDYANTYEWDFGDGGTGSTDKDPAAHIYAAPGFYQVKLKITGVSGCTDETTKTIRVKGPIGNLTVGAATGCIPFTLPMKVTGSNISSYAWDFGDGTPVQPSTESEVAHVYPLAGTYRPNVILTSPEGCPFTLKAPDPVIVDSAFAKYSIDRPIRCNLDRTVQFTNLSTSAFAPRTYKWLFGDNQESTDEAPVHTYNTPGKYDVTLIVFSRYGCSDTISSQPVVIYKQPEVRIFGDKEKCAKAQVDYRADVISEDAITDYTWKIDQSVVSRQDRFDHRFNTAGTYRLSLTVNTQYGCEETAEEPITIRPLPVPAASPKNTTICIGSPVSLQAHDGDRFSWWPNQWMSGANTDHPQVSPQQDMRYYVKVTNQYGCEELDSVDVHVDEKVNLQHSKDVIICKGERTRLSASGNTPDFVWTPALGLNNPNIASPVASPQQTTTYEVTGISHNTCPSETGRIKVTVGEIPTVDLGPDLTVEAGKSVTLQPVLSNDVVYYNWQPATGLSCINCATPRFIADKDITYRLTVRTQYQCEASDAINIKVACGKGAVYIPNAFTPNHDGKNDRFNIRGFGIQKVKSFRIYNRWGQLVFNRENFLPNDSNAGWDGRFNGQIAEGGTYVYITEVICNEGKPLVLKGTVILIR